MAARVSSHQAFSDFEPATGELKISSADADVDQQKANETYQSKQY